PPVQLLVGGRVVDERARRERCGWREAPPLARDRLDDARGVAAVVSVLFGHGSYLASKVARSPDAAVHSKSTEVTCADGGPRRSQARNACRPVSGPSATTDTLPSSSFWTQPESPCRRASRAAKARKPTP